MQSLIIYGSEYGTTKGYAEKLSEMTGIPSVNYKDINHLNNYEMIIHFGGLYAGGIKGLKRTLKMLPKDAKIIIVTVGLADVCKEENIKHIQESIRKQVPKEVLDHAIIFHLRGGIDYKKLNLKHRMMMDLLYKSIKRIPKENQTAEQQALIETFHQKVDFVEYHSLDPIVETIHKV